MIRIAPPEWTLNIPSVPEEPEKNLAAARATKPSGRAARIRRVLLVLYCVRRHWADVFDVVTGSRMAPRGAGNQLQIGNPRGP